MRTDYIPSEFSSLALGEKTELDAGILNVNVIELVRQAEHTDGDEVFRRINHMLAQCMPLIEKKGIVMDFRSSGVLSLFPEHPQEALSVALDVFTEIEQLPEDERQYYKRLSVALCYGSVTVGMVGYGDRLAPLIRSPHVTLCGMLQQKAADYFTRVFVTETYLSQVPGAKEKYNHRMLGVVYLSHVRKKEIVYDIFEGDEPEIRNIKRRTRNMFEKGVELFLVHRFAEARGYFLEVIRTDRRDLAAKEYLIRCDAFIHGEADGQDPAAIYLEVL